MTATDIIMTQENIAPEYSVEVDLPSLGRAGKFFKLAANEDECSKIAARLGVIKIAKLEGEMRLSATKTDIKASGVVNASLIRECVSSLEPMPEQIDENFQISFSRQPPSQTDAADEESEDLLLPEYHEGEMFDVGELLVQQLSLAMTPFPRKPGAPSLAEQYGRSGPVSPFSDLQAMLEKDQKKQ